MTMNIYAHCTPNMDRNAAQKLDDLFVFPCISSLIQWYLIAFAGVENVSLIALVDDEFLYVVISHLNLIR
jgi:hypothetical protein